MRFPFTATSRKKPASMHINGAAPYRFRFLIALHNEAELRATDGTESRYPWRVPIITVPGGRDAGTTRRFWLPRRDMAGCAVGLALSGSAVNSVRLRFPNATRRLREPRGV